MTLDKIVFNPFSNHEQLKSIRVEELQNSLDEIKQFHEKYKNSKDPFAKSICDEIQDKILSVKNLAIDYDGKKIAENISFDVESGDFLVIFGENGSGKTSVIKSLLGIKSNREGSIEFLSGLRENEIGYLPQISDNQKSFPASVREVVLSGCLNKMGAFPFYRKKEKMRAEESMEMLGIKELRNESFGSLSCHGGSGRGPSPGSPRRPPGGAGR